MDAPQSGRALLVEDNATSRLTLDRMLQRLGYEVDLALDGEAAHRCIGSSSYDVLVLDRNLPGVDGIELSRGIRTGTLGAHSIRLPIVLLSGDALEPETSKKIEPLSILYLMKPISVLALKSAIAKATEQASGYSPMNAV